MYEKTNTNDKSLESFVSCFSCSQLQHTDYNFNNRSKLGKSERKQCIEVVLGTQLKDICFK